MKTVKTTVGELIAGIALTFGLVSVVVGSTPGAIFFGALLIAVEIGHKGQS